MVRVLGSSLMDGGGACDASSLLLAHPVVRIEISRPDCRMVVHACDLLG
jgi:hypothetical protein